MGALVSPLVIVLAIVALGVLIIVHEGGHYLLARWSGMRVDRFSIGFGPTITSFKRGDTLFQIAVIPLGGFVQIAGLNPGEETIAADDPRSYLNRPAWQRFLTIFAGPATNYVFATLVFAVLFLSYGVSELGSLALVDKLFEGKPAAAAGLLPGDEIMSIDGTNISDKDSVSELIKRGGGKAVAVVVRRDGKTLPPLAVVPERDGDKLLIGVQLTHQEQWVKCSLGRCLGEAVIWPIGVTRAIIMFLGDKFKNPSVSGFSGPLGIVKQMKEQFSLGLRSALRAIASISVALGIFNLLPFPALDGGRLIFLGWELVSRRRVKPELEQKIHTVGILVLLSFVVFITVKNDLLSWIRGDAKKPVPAAQEPAKAAPAATPTPAPALPPPAPPAPAAP